MVFIAHDHAHGAVGERRSPCRIVCEVVIKSMALQIRLVDHIKTVFVAEIIEFRRVGIVGRADRIDVELFHQDEVFPHQLHGNCTPVQIIMLMPIDSANQNGLSVDQEMTLFHFDRTETDPLGDGLLFFAFFIVKGYSQGVK